MSETTMNTGWGTEETSCPDHTFATPTHISAILLKDTKPFLDVSCSEGALEGGEGHCKYSRELTGASLPESRHVLGSEDTEVSH